MYLYVQPEVVAAKNEACRIYNESTPFVERSKHALEEVISKIHIKIIKNVRSRKKWEIVSCCRSGGVFGGDDFIPHFYCIFIISQLLNI